MNGPTKGHLVYFIVAGAFVKVGYSRDVLARMLSLQTANPLPLRLAHTIGYPTEARARNREKYWREQLIARGAQASGEWIELEYDVVGSFVRRQQPLTCISFSELFDDHPVVDNHGLIEEALQRYGLRCRWHRPKLRRCASARVA